MEGNEARVCSPQQEREDTERLLCPGAPQGPAQFQYETWNMLTWPVVKYGISGSLIFQELFPRKHFQNPREINYKQI